jgi:PAS domain-containing protein
LVAIVARALQKDPAQRYSTAGELGRDLRAFMDELGMGRRSEPRHSTFSDEDAIEARVSAAAFHALGVPAAGLFVDGTIAVANQRFARLVGKDNYGELEGAQILDTNLAQVHPALREDIRLVAMHGKMARRRLTYRRRGGEATTFRMICTPADGSCGHCVIVLHTIPNK